MNLSKAYVTLSGCVHEFIYHWNCLSVLHSSIFRTANFYWRHLRLLCLPVLFGHLETFSKWSKSLNLKTCLIRTTSASDRHVLVCVSAWFICISPLTNYNVCRWKKNKHILHYVLPLIFIDLTFAEIQEEVLHYSFRATTFTEDT